MGNCWSQDQFDLADLNIIGFNDEGSSSRIDICYDFFQLEMTNKVKVLVTE
ncbi:MAG: hypothetical protein IPL83_07010 [Bdellovibrionales bacterium]|nr:hypothetical protein [Bdellovibrionales bacterium]